MAVIFDKILGTLRDKDAITGTDLSGVTTADIAESTDKKYITNAEEMSIGTIGNKLDKNTAIVGATKTKITYDVDGLVTAGENATTADIADSTDKRYLTDAQKTIATQAATTTLSGYLVNTDWNTFNGKQAAIGFTPENSSNKSTDIVTDAASNTKYPGVKAIKDYADGLVVGLLDDRGSYNPTGTSAYPATGGSGTAGAILKGDLWFVSVAGNIGGIAVNAGCSVRALADTPGQTAGNWDIMDVGIGFIPQITKTLYVDCNRTDTYTATGSKDMPYKTIMAAVNAIAALAPTTYYCIDIATGIYAENIVLEHAGLKYIVLNGSGYVSINPASGNALQSTATNDNLIALHCNNIIFAKSIAITGSNGAVSFTDVLFDNCKFTGGTVAITCVNTFSLNTPYAEVAFAYSNVNWSWINAGQLQGNFAFTMDDTADLPSQGKDGTALITSCFMQGTPSFTIGGTATYNFAPSGCGRVGTNAVTVPAGVTVTAYLSLLRGTWTNNGTMYLRNSNVQGLAGTAPNLDYQPSSQVDNDSSVSGATVKDALETLAGLIPSEFTGTFTSANSTGFVWTDNTLAITHNLAKQFIDVLIYDNNNLRADYTVTATSTSVTTISFPIGAIPITGTYNVRIR